MTVSVTDTIHTYAYTVPTVLSYDFTLYEDSEILVTFINGTTGARTTKTLTTDYTVQKNPQYNGGTVTTNFSGSGFVELRLNLPFEQDYDWTDGGPLNLRALERMADKIVLRMQMLNYLVENEISLPAYKGTWLTATEYDIGDMVLGTAGSVTGLYHCLIAHTSGTFGTDVTAGKWEQLFSQTDLATAVDLPTVGVGDEGKVIRVNSSSTGYELDHIIPLESSADAGKMVIENISGGAYEVIDTPAYPFNRFRFEYYDTDSIVVYGYGQYWLRSKGYVYATSLAGIQVDLSNISGTNYWHYLYLDYSAITERLISYASKFVDATTAPTYSETGKGYYNGNDRCILPLYIDGSGNILKFWHDGGDVIYFDDAVSIRSGALGASWTEVDYAAGAPPLAEEIYTTLFMFDSTNNSILYFRPAQSSTSNGLVVSRVTAATSRWDTTTMFLPLGYGVGYDNKVDFLSDNGTTTSLNVYADGFRLPPSV